MGAVTVGPDGAFRFIVPEGKYTLTAERYGYRVRAYASERAYVTGLSLAGKPLENAILDIPATGISDLKITLTQGTAHVRGFAKKDGRPQVGVIIALAPAWATSDPVHFHGFMTDSDGSFDIEHLLPDEYRLFAVADPDFEYANPAVVRPLMRGAAAVTVAAGQTVDTTVTTR